VIRLLLLISVPLFFACCPHGGKPSEEHDGSVALHENGGVTETGTDDVEIQSEYDMSTVDDKDLREFKENLAKIEKEHGEQWDFCTCVIKNDSINKAFSKEVSDKEFDRLSERFDEIDQKCKAFLAQNPNSTPEERAIHEKKVKKCLKEAGIK
jgi:hypothetical protein